MIINKITASWETNPKIPIEYPNNTFKMRKMQEEAYKALCDKHHIIINAPTASGKTLAICWIITKHLRLNNSRKAIIAVPQTIIADGFRGEWNLSLTSENTHQYIDEEVHEDIAWCPTHYLCADSKESNKNQIISFLNREGLKNSIHDRILICSHASLIDAFQDRQELFKNIDICIDEAHHIRYTLGEETESDETHTPMEFCNQMGSLVSHSLKNDSIRLILSTATMFRGDRLEVIPQKYNDRFTRFHYPMDEYLKDCYYLNSFSYDFVMYQDYWSKSLKSLFNDHIGKTIVYIPNVGSRYYSYGTKKQDLVEVYKCISGNEKPKIKELDDGLTLIKKGKQWIKVINLVDDTNSFLREKRKELIISAHKHPNNSTIDIIVTLNMFREGANWKWADREIIIGTKGSLTDMNQIIGRLMRDAEGKKHVQAMQLLPFSFDQLNKEKFRDNLNEYSKVIFATMLLEDIISPINLKIPIKKEKKNNDEVKVPVVTRDYLREQIQDENEIISIWNNIRDDAIKAQDNGLNFGVNNEESRGKFAEITSEVLSTHGVKEHHCEIAEMIRRRWIIESIKKVKGVDLTDIDFDIIQVNPLKFWITYTSGMCGLDTFKKFREAVNTYCWLPFENARKFVSKLGLSNKEDWSDYSKSNKKPKNIPANPRGVYETNGWIGWGNWLGTNFVAHQNREYKSFQEARKYTRKLGLKNTKEWKEFCKLDKKPNDIPYSPIQVYKNKGWISWSNWLGSEFLSFKEAREVVRKFGLLTNKQWAMFCKSGKRPFNIPSDPKRSYKNKGWISWSNWLGSNKKSQDERFFIAFEEARIYVNKLRLNGCKDWNKYCQSGKKPEGIPSSPYKVFKNSGWIGWNNWLGTDFMDFKKAKENVKKLKIKSSRDWKKYSKSIKPKNIPSNPQITYKNKGWISWEDWLGNEFEYLSFEKAKEFVRKLRLKNSEDWRKYCKSLIKPKNIPSSPARIYKNNGWISFGDWLGTSFVCTTKRKYKPFKESRKYSIKLGLSSVKEWFKYCKSGKKIEGIPNVPCHVYKNKGWKNWGDWLGTGNIWGSKPKNRKE